MPGAVSVSYTHLRPRTNTFAAAFRVRSAAAYAIHTFVQEQGFGYVHTPLITGSDCEGAGEMFRVTTLDAAQPPRTEDGAVDYSQDFFGRQTNLTVSGQLEGEAMALAFGKIYTFGPTFRAENSNTPRHAAEFWMIEPEIAFADLADEMDLSEAMVKSVINYVLDTCPDEIAFFTQFFDKELETRLRHVAAVSYTHLVPGGFGHQYHPGRAARQGLRGHCRKTALRERFWQSGRQCHRL